MLPDGWHYQTIGDLADVLTGFAFESDKYVEPSLSAVRLLRGDNITPGAARWEGAKYWSIPYDESLTRYELEAGDIAIALDRPIISSGLKLSVLDEIDLPCLLVQRVARVRAKAGVSQNFLAQALRSQRFVNHLKDQKTETAVPHVSPNDVRAYPLATPPQSEQEQISRVLRTWDKAVNTNEQLLTNSHRQKQALINMLLTGKCRLPSYTGAWRNLILGDVCSFHKGNGLAKGDVSHAGGRACILYGELFTTYKELIECVISRTDSGLGFIANFGDVLIPTATTTVAEDLAKASALLVNDVAIGGDAIIVRPNRKILLPEFLAFLLTHAKKREIAARAQGATIVHLSIGDIDDLEISVPSVPEQRAIVEIFKTLELKAKAIECDIVALRKAKNVLTQQLLTGKRRVRLPIPQPAQAKPA